MATYTVTGAVAGVPLGIKPQIIEVVLDFSSTSLTTSDSVEVFEMKANTLVLMAGVEVLTVASTGSPVLDLGDDADDDLYVAAAGRYCYRSRDQQCSRYCKAVHCCRHHRSDCQHGNLRR